MILQNSNKKMEFISQLALIISIGVISGLIANKFKMPVIVGYILGGAVLAIFIKFEESELHIINSFAEVGIAMLLFTIGMEFSLNKLLNVKKYALLGGIVQIVLTILIGKFIFPLFGFTSYESLFLGSVFALSSTVVVVKILDEIGQIETTASQITIGWLILQDIAVVLLIIFLGNFAQGQVDLPILFESIFKSFLLIATALIVGNRLIPRILTTIAKSGSQELIVVTAFGFCFLVAYIANQLVGSFTLGAFLAGLMISESVLHHEIFTEIKPMQSIFSVIFFILIGTLFSLNFLVSNIVQIVLILLVVMVIKLLVVVVINLFFRLHVRNTIEVAINLAQIGEFAFLSASIGLAKSWISEELHSLIIAVTILSLIASPLLITHSDKIYERIRSFFQQRSPKLYRKLFMAPQDDIVETKKLKNHIILCGYGRVGKYIALGINRLRFKVVLIDMNSQLVEEAKSAGLDVIYGDATSEEILLQAGVESARAAIIALPKETDVVQIATKIRALNPETKVVIRRHNNNIDQEIDKQYAVIEPEFEAAIKIIEKVLPFLGKKDKKILKWLRDKKELLY